LAADCDRLDRRIEASIDEGAERLRTTLEVFKREHGLEADWLCLDGLASVVVPQHARYIDICILGQDVRADSDSVEYSFSEQLLFVAGRLAERLTPATRFSCSSGPPGTKRPR